MTVQTPRIDRLDKNYIINGGFDHAQRSTGGTALIDSILSYDGPDRFVTRYFGGAPSTDYAWERSTDAPSYRTRYSGRFYNINVPDIATGLTLQQRVLSSNSVELTGEVCSLGFKYKAESFRKVTVKLSVPNAVDDHSAVTTFHDETYDLTTGLGSWLWFKLENITFPLTCSNGVQVDLFFHDSSITGSNTEIRVGEVKLNRGNFAQEFSYCAKNSDEEFDMCLNYFERINFGAAPDGNVFASGFNFGTTGGSALMTYRHKRSSPIITRSNASDFLVDHHIGAISCTVLNILTTTRSYARVSYNVTTGLTAGHAVLIRAVLGAFININSEL